MCGTCGCNVTSNADLLRHGDKHTRHEKGAQAITLLHNLLSENDRQALHNRQHFDHHRLLAINIMSSPGAGKTALLEATIDAFKAEYRIAVIEGDLETENDAQRIRAKGIPAIQITTGSACHLDAHMVHDVLHQLDLASIDILFIENVGNLICPASFDLGQHRNVTLLSTTEGDDKPAKYPVMFRVADFMVLSKTDLLPLLDDFDPGKAEFYLRQLANDAPTIALSAKTKSGMDAWLDWLKQQLKLQREGLTKRQATAPALSTAQASARAHPPP